MTPKWDPKRTKIEDEIRHEKKTLRIRLGAVLGRSWVVLGAVFGLSWDRRTAFRLGESAFREK